MIRRFFTLEDVLFLALGNVTDEAYKGPAYLEQQETAGTITGLYGLLNKAIYNIYGTQYTEADDTYTKQLASYVYDRFNRSDCFFCDGVYNEDDKISTLMTSDDEFKEKASAWCGKVHDWLKESYLRYTKLLTAYNAKIDSLTDGITSKTRTNTNPQTQTDAFNEAYSDSASVTISEDMNPIDELANIRNKMYNVYKEWATEFRKFIVRYR